MAETQKIISDCSTRPALPNGFEINKRTCEITGTATAITEAMEYEITPRNGAGYGNAFNLSIVIIDCSSDGKVAYSIIYFTGSDPSQVIWELRTEAYDLIVSNDAQIQNVAEKEYYFTGCADSTNYKLIMNNPSSGNPSWPETAYVLITITGMPSLKFRKIAIGEETQDIASK